MSLFIKVIVFFFFFSIKAHASQFPDSWCEEVFTGSNSSALAMSDREKREFIENLVKPFKEKRVFYRWQPKRISKKLIKAGEMTPQLYKHFISKNDSYAGGGLYVSEDITSSMIYGNSFIQVEVEPGYRYLDLLDIKIQEKLKAAGITNRDIYRLNPGVAVKDIKERYPYWVLKGQEGVRFKPPESSSQCNFTESTLEKRFCQDSIYTRKYLDFSMSFQAV